jgi:hypothetical protein
MCSAMARELLASRPDREPLTARGLACPRGGKDERTTVRNRCGYGRARRAVDHGSGGKGLVIGLKGRTGTFPYHQSVTLIVSSGKKKKAKRH